VGKGVAGPEAALAIKVLTAIRDRRVPAGRVASLESGAFKGTLALKAPKACGGLSAGGGRLVHRAILEWRD